MTSSMETTVKKRPMKIRYWQSKHYPDGFEATRKGYSAKRKDVKLDYVMNYQYHIDKYGVFINVNNDSNYIKIDALLEGAYEKDMQTFNEMVKNVELDMESHQLTKKTEISITIDILLVVIKLSCDRQIQKDNKKNAFTTDWCITHSFICNITNGNPRKKNDNIIINRIFDNCKDNMYEKFEITRRFEKYNQVKSKFSTNYWNSVIKLRY